jgi:hypothetical protein
MYDTVNFWMGRVEAGSGFDASTLHLENARETVDRATGEAWTVGDADNLKVTVSMAGISVKGSLARFYLPDNTYTLNRHLVKDAIEKLSDTLHVDLTQANVTRMDVSTSFIMKHGASDYYGVLGLCRHFNRVQATGNTLYYHNRGKERKRTMVFYDKAREVTARNGVVPEVYRGANLLRYESRWNTRLPQQLKEPEIRGRTLFDRRFYSRIIGLWADGYFSIEKKKKTNHKAMEEIKTVSDATDYICALALQRLPADEVQYIMSEMKQRNVFSDRNYYTRLHKKLKDIAGKAASAEQDDLVKELDGEVRQILAYKR